MRVRTRSVCMIYPMSHCLLPTNFKTVPPSPCLSNHYRIERDSRLCPGHTHSSIPEGSSSILFHCYQYVVGPEGASKTETEDRALPFSPQHDLSVYPTLYTNFTFDCGIRLKLSIYEENSFTAMGKDSLNKPPN